MKKLLNMVGTGLFWLLWPAWVVYFRFSGNRPRVLVVYGDEVLLVQGWVGSKKWSLPGGGAKRYEKSSAAAVRELREETGIDLPESSLTKLCSYKHATRRLKYSGDLFSVCLPEKPILTLKKMEIWRAEWFVLGEINELIIDNEAQLALRRYRPPEQASLL